MIITIKYEEIGMLEVYKEKLKSTCKPAMRITLSDKVAEYPWNSKVGGVPYLPVGMAYPVDSEGNKLQFLAQINFEEMPALDGYPSQGILAFYVGADDLSGVNYEDPMNQDDFKVIYFEHVTHNVQLIEPEYTEYSPIEREASMCFMPVEQIMSICDFNFKKILGEDDYNALLYSDDDAFNAYLEYCDPQGHLLGGYPYFTQDDPRQYTEEIQDYVLLFQLDSDVSLDICWGDAGVANFFIHPDDLKNRDFSRVAYTWDCT